MNRLSLPASRDTAEGMLGKDFELTPDALDKREALSSDFWCLGGIGIGLAPGMPVTACC